MKVGRFEVDVSNPYPVWIRIGDDRGQIRFSHRELRDLEYAVNWAIREAKAKLKTPSGDDGNEV